MRYRPAFCMPYSLRVPARASRARLLAAHFSYRSVKCARQPQQRYFSRPRARAADHASAKKGADGYRHTPRRFLKLIGINASRRDVELPGRFL